MMRGAIVVITAGMAMLFLGRKQYTHHYVSLAMIVAAVAIVGLAGIAASDDGKDDKTPTTPMGVGLIILAQLFTGGQFVTEEKLLSGYYLDPLLVVGLEGFWGCIYYSILLPIFQNVHCETKADDSGSLCHYNPASGFGPKAGNIEDTGEAWMNLTNSGFLIVTSLGIIVSIACFNATGVAITKFASAPQRSTVDTSRTLLIWIVQMAMGEETFIPLQLVGFVLLVLGTLIYNEIWIVPIDCMNRMTNAKQAERENENGGLLDDHVARQNQQNYMASSPTGLKHDSNRYLNNIERAKASMGDKRQKQVDAHDGNFYMNNVGETAGGAMKNGPSVGDQITEED